MVFLWFQVGVLWFSRFQVNSFLVPGRFLWFQGSRLVAHGSKLVVMVFIVSVRCFMVPGRFS